MNKKKFFLVLLALVGSINLVYAGNVKPIAIVGGQSNAPYAALLYANGELKTLADLPKTGLTYRVAMNASNKGLIGGTHGSNAYAAFVAPHGKIQSITGLIAPGEIYTVAMNSEGYGIVGGGHLKTNTPFAAIVGKNAKAIPLTNLPNSGLTYGVALDKDGDGIIGGVGPSKSAYAALTSRKNTVTPLAGLPKKGAIFWTSMNESKMRFIGGQKNVSLYAAFVKTNGKVIPVANLPLGQNYSVSINAKGNALMGGTSQSLPYAALVNRKGKVKSLSGLPTGEGIIYNVSLNASGTGLIAGFSGSRPYGSFIKPDGSLVPLQGLPKSKGFLDGIALHPTGVGLVGGIASDVPFVALAAPNGKLSYLKGLPPHGEINSIAISVLEKVVPKSIGPYESYANTQFALSSALNQHFTLHHKNYFMHSISNPLEKSVESTLWLTPFVNFNQTKVNHPLPAFTNDIGGILLGFDYKEISEIILGGGVAYSQNYAHFDNHLGHAKIKQESVVLYASWNKPYLYINAALWGGLNQTSIKRNSFSDLTAKAHPYGWNISPHLEISSPFAIHRWTYCTFDPFVSLDWTQNKQLHYREHGDSGFNIELKDQTASLLRTELGCRFYKTFDYAWGLLITEEKISYINKAPTHQRIGTASFIGSSSSFEVITYSSRIENLGCIQMHIECLPLGWTNLSTAIDYQGEFGSRYQSHLLSLALERSF